MIVAPLAGSVDRNGWRAHGLRQAHGSLPSRGAWIEIAAASHGFCGRARSLPSRGAWIEMLYAAFCGIAGLRVAPLAGSVDRNRLRMMYPSSMPVAPLAGSVDRNCTTQLSR